MKQKYKFKYHLALFNHQYFTQMKGDTSCFRYPHLKYYFRNFDADLKNDVFLLNRNQEDVLKCIGKESLEVLSQISNEAYFVYVMTLLGLPVSEEEKIKAYKSICKLHKSRSFIKQFSNEYATISVKTLPISKEYKELKKYLQKSLEYPIILKQLNFKKFRNLAHSMHGTNILYTDMEDYNYGVGLIEKILHQEEGIKGRNLKNLNIEETWANAPLLALHYLNHEIPSINPDLFFMKGYLALAFQNKNTTYNALYAFTEPYIKLLFSTIDMEALLEYVFLEDATKIKESFEEKYPLFYDKIYQEKSIFNRIEMVQELAVYHDFDLLELYKTMFNKKHLVNSYLDHHVIAFIYLSPKVREEKTLIYDLIVNCHPWGVEHKTPITIENWGKHIKLKYGEAIYQKINEEYLSLKSVLDQI